MQGVQAMSFSYKFDDLNGLSQELQRLNNIRFDAVEKKQLVQMLNRARAAGGTPVRTGELRLSSGITEDTMGYTKEYAPYVEYGHRLVRGKHSFLNTGGGQTIGYVQGQYFLLRNVQQQQPIF